MFLKLSAYVRLSTRLYKVLTRLSVRLSVYSYIRWGGQCIQANKSLYTSLYKALQGGGAAGASQADSQIFFQVAQPENLEN